MGRTFFIADMHFGHTNIIKYERRPFTDAQQMDYTMISNWNKTVEKDDKVFVLGDVSFYNEEKTSRIVKSLNGSKQLILGNHDSNLSIEKWYNAGFDFVSPFPVIAEEFLVLSHEPPQYIPQDTPYFYLYGHVHGSEMYKTITKTSACMCVERWDYAPVELNTLVELIKSK